MEHYKVRILIVDKSCIMVQYIKQSEWTLIVNGEVKPWPVNNYLETPITIDLNWGIDTNIYQSTPISFNVSEIINGSKIDGITVDREHNLIICDIPIRKRCKNIKIIVDWTSIKDHVKNDIQVVVGGKNIKIEDGMIHLSGKDISAPLDFYFNGVKCDYNVEDNMNMIRVNLPYNHAIYNSLRAHTYRLSKRIVCMLAPICIAMLSIVWTLGYIMRRPSREVVTEIMIDTVHVSKSLEIAQSYLQRDKWRRDEMELIPELNGLFDELKEYRLKDIRKRLDREEYRDVSRVQELLTYLDRYDVQDPISTYPCDDEITFAYYVKELREQNRRRNKTRNINDNYQDQW